jgi:mannose/cellobiose epimerase-like protein (N-acyl-D-glucosamine 2-epimerase family)
MLINSQTNLLNPASGDRYPVSFSSVSKNIAPNVSIHYFKTSHISGEYKMRYLCKIILPLIFTTSLFAQYTIKSAHLQDPAKAIGFVDSCAQFWINTYDPVYGGFYTNIDKFGNVIYNQNKHMLTQTRNVYGMVRAYMLTANTVYLNYAKEALNFMYQHAWDVTSSGWLQELDEQGNAINPQADKTCFYQHYALLGIAAYYECTRDTLAWKWLMQGYAHLENHFWDSRLTFEGYYDLTDYDTSNPRNKSFNATVDAITTHLLYLYLMTGKPEYLLRLEELADEIMTRLLGSMPSQAIGFVERFDSDWNWNNNETMTIMGHVLKSGWCMGRIQQLAPKPAYIAAAESLVTHVLNNGYDHEYGGPYKDYNRLTGEMLMWGNPDTTKAWWAMEQAITSGLMLFDLTGDTLYLKMADETTDFTMKYFVDHQYGEVYGDRTRYGAFAWNENKAGDWKAGYHSIEMGYYIYLYTNLFVHHQPVVLHYRFYDLPVNRDILLTPLAISHNDLQIQQILHEGQPYSNYDPIARVLHLPAHTSGNFEVTYAPAATPILATPPDQIPQQIQLYQNYPNPFNPTTTISWQLAVGSQVTLTVFDLSGRKMAELVNQYQPAGSYQIKFDASELASGLYIYQLQTGGTSDIRKMILLK